MKVSLISFIFLFLLICALALGDLNETKKNALKKVEGYVASIKKLADDTSVEVDKRVDNVKIISKHEREFGDGIIGETRFEVAKTAKSAYMMANLLGSSNDVFRCIERREREALDDTDRYYSQKFLDPGRDYETKAEQYQRNLIKTWKDDYYKAIDQYSRIYQTTVAEIQKATSDAAITNILKQFDYVTKQMADIIVGILPVMNRTHIQVLQTFDQIVNNLQTYAKYRVEETSKAIQQCFPKILNLKNFLNPLFL